jgi:hypothetical protein
LQLVKLPECVEDVVKRTCDVDPAVRKSAVSVITEKVSLTVLPSEMCLQVLVRGLKDANRAVFEASVKLLKIWYQETNYEIITVCSIVVSFLILIL